MTDDCAANADERLKREARDWVIRLSSANVTTADAVALNRWRATSQGHRKAFAEANRSWEMARLSALEAIAEGAAAGWQQIDAERRRGIDRRFFLGGALAASAAGAGYLVIRPPLHLWPGISELTADARTAIGEQRSVVTDKGAAVELNTRTSVNFPLTAGGADQIELVAGEAAISAPVASRPVMVLAADGQSVTNGAQFNVRYDGPEVQVTCLSGTVAVHCGGETATLTRRQQVSYGRAKLGRIGEIDPEVITAWREGLLVFRNDPLQRVIDEVNRYRPGRIGVLNQDLARRLVFASFRLDRLDYVVTRMAKVFGARVRTFPGGIVVLS